MKKVAIASFCPMILPLAAAQENSGSIAGKVEDAMGNPLPGVAVEAKGRKLACKAAAVTAEDGGSRQRREREIEDGGRLDTPSRGDGKRKPAVIEALIARGGQVNAQTSAGDTPLLLVARHYLDQDAAAIAKLLLDAGADVNAKDSAGQTPLCRRRQTSSCRGDIDRKGRGHQCQRQGWADAAARG